jgi:hypothetical protein
MDDKLRDEICIPELQQLPLLLGELPVLILAVVFVLPVVLLQVLLQLLKRNRRFNDGEQDSSSTSAIAVFVVGFVADDDDVGQSLIGSS